MSAGSPDQILKFARHVIQIEADAVAGLSDLLDDRFLRVIEILQALKGRVVTTGVGKSGQVARRVASTLTSTGTPAFFLHPVDALHGDLGMVREGDVALMLSASGSTDELIELVPLIRRIGVTIIALTGVPDSPLGRKADVVLDCGMSAEACPHNLAPTASVIAASAMGDALAMTLVEVRGFTKDDFAKNHPGGRLGRMLLMEVSELMHDGDRMPGVASNTLMRDALLEMTSKRLGCTVVTEPDGRLSGIFTDGDLRRLTQSRTDFLEIPISEVMRANPRTVEQDERATAALNLMETHKITQLIIVDDDRRPVGVLHLHDLLRSGIT